MSIYNETKENPHEIENEIHFYHAYGANDTLTGIIIEHFKQARREMTEIAVSDNAQAEGEIANYLTSVEDLGKYTLFFEFETNESLLQKLAEVDHVEIIDNEDYLVARMGKEHEKALAMKSCEVNEYTETKVKPLQQRMPDYWISKGSYQIPVYTKGAKK